MSFATTEPGPLVGELEQDESSPDDSPPIFRIGANDCKLVLTPSEPLFDTVTWWAAAWSDTALCKVSVGPDGVPITFGELAGFVNKDGEYVQRGGRATVRFPTEEQFVGHWFPIRIVLREGLARNRWTSTVGHEIGHLLGARHTALGLMSNPARGQTIDALALAAVCESLHCPDQYFNPNNSKDATR